MIGPLHRWFLDEDGVLYASVTQSVKNLGDILCVPPVRPLPSPSHAPSSAGPG